MRRPRPAWGSLYAVIPLAATLLVAAHLGTASDGWRQLAEGMASLVIIAAMAPLIVMTLIACTGLLLRVGLALEHLR